MGRGTVERPGGFLGCSEATCAHPIIEIERSADPYGGNNAQATWKVLLSCARLVSYFTRRIPQSAWPPGKCRSTRERGESRCRKEDASPHVAELACSATRLQTHPISSSVELEDWIEPSRRWEECSTVSLLYSTRRRSAVKGLLAPRMQGEAVFSLCHQPQLYI